MVRIQHQSLCIKMNNFYKAVLGLLGVSLLSPLAHAAYPTYPDTGCILLKNPPGDDTKCGVRGHIGDGISSLQYTEDFQSCENLCLRRAPPKRVESYRSGAVCSSFGYNEKTHLCSLLYRPLTSEYFKPSKSNDVVAYDVICYDCSNYCDPQSNPGIAEGIFLDNPGFEDNNKLFGPWSPQSGSSRQKLIGHPGFEGQNLLNISTSDGGNDIQQAFRTCAQDKFTLYEITFFYKAILIDPEARPAVSLIVGDLGDILSPKAVNTDGYWTKYTNYFFTPGPKVHTLQLTLGAVDSNRLDYQIDQADIRLLNGFEIPQPVLGAKEILTNGGFESGALSPWRVTQPFGKGNGTDRFDVVSPGLGGSKFALQIKPTTHPNYNFAQFEQALPESPEVRSQAIYILSFDFAGSNQTSLTPQIATPCSIEDDLSCGSFFNSVNLCNAGRLNGDGLCEGRYSRPLLLDYAPGSALNFQVFYAGSADQQPVVYLDNVSFKPAATLI